jgi:hypothetical protein
MRKAAGHHLVQRILAGMAEWGMSQIMSKRHGFDKVFIQTKSAGYCAGDTAYLKSMRQTGAVMIAFGAEKYLSFFHQPAKCLRVGHAVYIALKTGPNIAFVDLHFASHRL